MSGIVLSAGVRQNLLSLQNTADLMSLTQNRLATGKKVNTALDNPTNYFTSAALQSRSKDLNALLDSMSNGIKTLEAADNGITAINRTIESMQSTLRQARQDKSFQSTSYTIDPLMDTSAVKYLSIAGGAVGANPVQIALNSADSIGATHTTSATGGQFSTISSAFDPATNATFTAGAFTAIDFTNGGANDGQITFNLAIDGGAPQPITIAYADVAGALTASGGSAVTAAELRDIINTKAGTTVASLDGTDLAFTSGSAGSGSAVAVTGFSATNGATGSGIANNSATGSAAGAGVSFSLTVGTNAAKTISVSRADVLAAGLDNTTGGGINSVNLQAAINTKLAAAGITSVQAAKSGGPGVSAATDLMSLRATAVGPATTFTVGSVTGNVVGTAVTSGTGTPGAVRTIDALVSDINSNTALKDKIRASNDNGKLRIENLSTSVLSLTGVNASAGTVTGGAGIGTISGNEVRINFVKQFNGFIDQLNKLADDASYNGVNLLRGDKLKITFNENGSSTIEIQAKDASGNPTSVNTNTLAITQATNAEFDSDSLIDTRLDVLTNALGSLRSQASLFGSNLSVVQNRQDFTKSMMNTLQTGADNLVLADTNEEGANMLALQTRQQLSTTALSLANQASQAVLRLFG